MSFAAGPEAYDRFMTPEEAVEYGLIDDVLGPRPGVGRAVASAA